MLELLFLLLPIAAGYGWYMGDRNARHRQEDKSHHLSMQYVTGLNLLLSEKSDQAVDIFIELLQVDNETIDTHLALGNLFRSRGEVDRAIRIHQNLIARSSLTLEQRNLALQQLAKDYIAAGFLDRAEKIFIQLTDEPEHQKLAWMQLVTIYQQTREWEKAIAVAQQLIKQGKSALKGDVGHFYCELAKVAFQEENFNAAAQLLKNALGADKSCVRASLALAELDLKKGEYKSAAHHLEAVLEQDPDFIPEVLAPLELCYQKLNKEGLLQPFLTHCLEKGAGASVELRMADLIWQAQNEAMAQTFLSRQLTKNPTMRGFHKLMELHVAQAEEGRAKTSLTMLKELVEAQLKVKPQYCCRKCGFSSRSLYWQCPSCKNWGAVKPIKGLDGE